MAHILFAVKNKLCIQGKKFFENVGDLAAVHAVVQERLPVFQAIFRIAAADIKIRSLADDANTLRRGNRLQKRVSVRHGMRSDVRLFRRGFTRLVFFKNIHLQKGSKFKLQKLRAHFLRKRHPDRACVQVETELDRAVDPRQRLGKISAVLSLFQFYPDGIAQFAEMCIQVVQIVISGNKRKSRLFADARNPGDIIRAVAHERFYVYDLPRLISQLFLKIAGRKFIEFAHARFCDINVRPFVNQLIRVPVAGYDDAVRIRIATGERSDDVVRLETLFFAYGYVHGTQERFQDRHLHRQVVGHGFSRRLILVVHFMAERRRLQVKRYDQPVGLDVAVELEQKFDESENGVCRRTRLCRKKFRRIKRAVEKAVAVDEYKFEHDRFLLLPFIIADETGICKRLQKKFPTGFSPREFLLI